MRRFLIVTVAVVALLLVAAQVVLPGRVEGDVRRDLEQDQGQVSVDISAWPAATLLAGRGREIDVSGRDLEFDLSEPAGEAFDRLDGFARVAIQLRAIEVGPVEISSLDLTRGGRGERYVLAFAASTTPKDLAREVGSRQGGLLGGFAGSLAGDALPDDGEQALNIDVDAQLSSEDGRPLVEDAKGSVEGIPTGPLTELVVGAVLTRL